MEQRNTPGKTFINNRKAKVNAGAYLRRYRSDNNLTLKQVGDKCGGLPIYKISDAETRGQLTLETAQAIAKGLGIRLSTLFGMPTEKIQNGHAKSKKHHAKAKVAKVSAWPAVNNHHRSSFTVQLTDDVMYCQVGDTKVCLEGPSGRVVSFSVD